jgi:hypothetical protein
MTSSVPAATAFEYAGDGSTKAFSFPLRFLENADLRVSLVASTGDETLKVVGTHYTVTGAGHPMGGTVTFITAPGSTDRVKIARLTVPKQTVDLSDLGRTPGDSLEQQLDRIAMALQDVQRQLTEVETAPGPPGLNSYLFGNGAPSSDDGEDGEDGDVYQDRLNGDQYKKVSGAWVLQDNLTGPQGEQGPQGPQGDLGGFDPERVTVLEANFRPGDGKISFRRYAADPDGWLLVTSNRTIGDASSGASVAHAKTEALFAALWADYSNAELPILTSAGGASTRGASAAADWAAHKRLTLPNPMDRFARMASGTRSAGLKEANQNKEHNHTATFSGSPLAGHQHGVTRTVRRGANGSFTSGAWEGGDTSVAGSTTIQSSSVSAGTPAGTIAVANAGASEARPDSFVFTCLIKL